LANYQDFVDGIKSGDIQFREVSPSSVANYMEAFANEGILGWVPYEYLKHDEIRVALSVVLTEPVDICQ
jgi:hypothetical protein